jgi:predicted amidophosphoribosyltransferase
MSEVVSYLVRFLVVLGIVALVVILKAIFWHPSTTDIETTFKPPPSKKCPYCAEDIKPDAKLCRYCGRDLPATSDVSGQSGPDVR